MRRTFFFLNHYLASVSQNFTKLTKEAEYKRGLSSHLAINIKKGDTKPKKINTYTNYLDAFSRPSRME